MSKKHEALVGMAQISRTTTKLDQLLALPSIADKAVAKKMLEDVKRDILAGLAYVQDGLKA